ncbi:stage V sporulation protein AE [Robertmurraya siralis]|uniref:Stage V sporulation protein AE n=1 Tax=Robertmurraya siralis TaxID=77777 RepID=A0A919WEU7_9BACI|nr:stage V sporulation protein AE [Robertmurraya siralis]PAE22050.1 stage V sporulation protein AE [Bacillus sp. 7504-2]GIN60673.1 stage V sporulation protein AE [Robertmurraya siralis]
MGERKRIIIITDGDEYARKAVEHVATEIGGRCISMSHGNPTALTGSEMVALIKKAPYEPVLVMFDDSGLVGEGYGESALKFVAKHPDIEVLGVLAVAAKTRQAEWTKIDVSVDRYGELTPYGVDKYGEAELEIGRLNGDTVYSLDALDLPVVVGIGDIGKMAGKDSYEIGAPITKKAIEIILERSGFHEK